MLFPVAFVYPFLFMNMNEYAFVLSRLYIFAHFHPSYFLFYDRFKDWLKSPTSSHLPDTNQNRPFHPIPIEIPEEFRNFWNLYYAKKRDRECTFQSRVRRRQAGCCEGERLHPLFWLLFQKVLFLSFVFVRYTNSPEH